MAYEGNLQTIPGAVASGDLSSDQFKFVKQAASGMALNTTNGASCSGILQDKPSALGEGACVAFGGVSKVKTGAAVANGARIMSNASGLAITAAVGPTAASKVGGAQTYALTAGQTVILDVDNVGGATATWDAAAATITDTTSYPVTDQDGLTSIITVDGGSAQTVTFSGATTTAAVVAAQMNTQLVGCSVAVVGGQVKITTDSKGTGSSLVAAAGTGGLTWDTPVAGTGDVVDISAVTAAEFETVLEADTTALVSVTAGVPTITSPTTGATSELDFTGGTALTAFGLSVETLTGSDSGTQDMGFAMQAASGPGEIIAMVIQPSGKVG